MHIANEGGRPSPVWMEHAREINTLAARRLAEMGWAGRAGMRGLRLGDVKAARTGRPSV